MASADVSAPPSALPPATYPTTYSEQRFIRMDDGVELGATITFPSLDGSAPAPGRFPVVLNMTPYGRDGACSCESASDYATRGFVLAVVDVRGTGGSQGNLDDNYFSPREARDGYDLVEYLGTQPWSNGKVGMSGGSYLGITQYLTAEQDPPHLAAIAPNEALADIYNDAAFPGGIVSLFFDAQYLAVQGAPGLDGPEHRTEHDPGHAHGQVRTGHGPIDRLRLPRKPVRGLLLLRPLADHAKSRRSRSRCSCSTAGATRSRPATSGCTGRSSVAKASRRCSTSARARTKAAGSPSTPPTNRPGSTTSRPRRCSSSSAT